MPQKAAKIHKHRQLLVIREICLSQANCVLKTGGSKHGRKLVVFSHVLISQALGKTEVLL